MEFKNQKPIYLQIADCDTKKQKLAQDLGFAPVDESFMAPCGDVWLPFRIYK